MPFLSTRKQRAGALVAALGLTIFVAILPFASGLLAIAILYVLFAPAHRWLSRWLPRRASALVVTLLALTLILLPGGLLVALALGEAPETLRGIQQGELFERMQTLRVGGFDVGARIAEAGGTMASWVSTQAFAFFGSAARGALSMVIAFFGLYYLLLSPGVVWGNLRDYLPFSDETTERLRHRFYRVTEATLVGTALTALVQGTMVGVAFWAVGLPSAVFWGFMTALASVLPVMGSALIWLPGVTVLVMSGRYVPALVLLVVGLVAGSVDNLVRLFVFKAVSNIHPMATLVGAFTGLKYFGLIGVLLGPLAIAYFFELLKMYREEYVHGAAASSDALDDPPTEADPLPDPA